MVTFVVFGGMLGVPCVDPMDITEVLAIDVVLNPIPRGAIAISSMLLSSDALSVLIEPDVGMIYRESWVKLGWANQRIETNPGVFQMYRGRVLLSGGKQVIKWGRPIAPYTLLMNFVPWLPPSRVRVWQVFSFPSECENTPLNPLDFQQQFSPPFLSGEAISSFSVVRLSGETLYIADCRDVSGASATLGLLTVGVVSGASTQVLMEGIVSNPDWNWLTSEPLWLGEDGELTQTPPTSGFLQRIGFAVDGNTIRVEIQEGIIL